MNQRPNSLFGGAMLRLSIAYFYDLGMAMRPLKQLEGGQNLQAVWPDLYAAENALNQFLATDWMWGAIKSSYALGQQLSTAIKTLTSDPAPDRPLTPLEAYSVVSALWAYEPVLRADLSVADTYYVTRKGGYDTWTLITNAEALFPGPLTAKVPDALADVQEAGKCLAFELCTASGIHILRALELVLKAYFKAVTNGAPLPNDGIQTYDAGSRGSASLPRSRMAKRFETTLPSLPRALPDPMPVRGEVGGLIPVRRPALQCAEPTLLRRLRARELRLRRDSALVRSPR